MSLSLVRATGPLLAEVRAHCEDFHYLHRWPDPRSLPFGYALQVDGQLRAPDGRLLGLLVMKKPQHHHQRGLFGWPGLPTAWQVLDLTRVWIHPDLQQPGANVFSQMVGRMFRCVQADWLEHHPPRYPDLPYHITLIISYCELEHHDGTAYRASGFTSAGKTVDGSKEVYVHRLKPPLKSWQPKRQFIKPMFEGLPLRHT